MLCYNGHLQNGSVHTHFFHFSSTETSSATSGYVTILERPLTIEQPIVELRNRLGTILFLTYFYLTFNEVVCIFLYLNMKYWASNAFNIFSSKIFWKNFSENLPITENIWPVVLETFVFVDAWITVLMSVSNGSSPYFFHRKMEMTRPVRKKRRREEEMFFFRWNWLFLFVEIIFKVFFPTLNPDLAHKYSCFPPGKS